MTPDGTQGDDSVAVSAPAEDWTRAPLVEVMDHVTRHFHDRLRLDLPALGGLLRRLVAGDAAEEGRLDRLRHLFRALHEDLLQHMHAEEAVLFPLVERLEGRAADGETPRGPLVPIGAPLELLEHEHRQLASRLAALRELAEAFSAAAGGAAERRRLVAAIAAVERDALAHIALEDDVLFPRARRLARRHGLL